MDNASKALVMAGAILIAVMLISLGVLLFNQARERTTGLVAGVDSDIVNSHNNIFENFVGVNKSQADVRSLVSRISAYNANTADSAKYGKITVSGTGIGGNQTTGYTLNESQAKAGMFYTIKVTNYYTSTDTSGTPGCIKTMTVAGSLNRTAQ